MFTKKDAEAIADKLDAVIEEGKRRHTLAIFYYKGKRVVSFGIRRGSRKDQDHGHLPSSLHLTPHNTRKLADCPLTYEEYVMMMKEKGVIHPDKDDTAPAAGTTR